MHEMIPNITLFFALKVKKRPSSIDTYQYILRQIEYVARSPLKYNDRLFSLMCVGVNGQMPTNEVRVRVHVKLNAVVQSREFPQVYAALSNKFVVDNNEIKKNSQPSGLNAELIDDEKKTDSKSAA
ncbi:unnamed protein product, partial [Didymodactylos carnosus]